MTRPMKLSQTLAGDWSLSVPNPEERFCWTELADFRTSATGEGSLTRDALERAAAQAAADLMATALYLNLEVTSHHSAAAQGMYEKVVAAGGDVTRLSHTLPPRW